MQRRGLRRSAGIVGPALVPALLLALVAGGCSKDKGAPDGAGGGSAKAALRIGLVYDVGGLGDGGTNDAAQAGLAKAHRVLGVTTDDLEPSPTGEDREDLIRSMADGGYDLVVGVGAGFAPAVQAVAADHPKVHFALVDGTTTPAANITDLVLADEQGAYLVGAAAALTSTTGKVGLIGRADVDPGKRFEAGYMAGAQKAKPAIGFDARYLTDPATAATPAAAKDLALAEYGSGSNVVAAGLGVSAAGLIDAAAAVGRVWAIGSGVDAFDLAAPPARGVVLTTMVRRVDLVVFDAIQAFTQGTLDAGVRTFDLGTKAVGYTTTGGKLSAEVLAQLTDLQQQILSDQIEVPTTP